MKTWRFGVVTGAVLATFVIVGASCGDDDDDETPPPAPPATVDPDPLNLEIQSVTIPPGEAVRPVIRFRVTDATGAAVDLPTEIANWNLGVPTSANRVAPHIIPRFTLAQLDDFGDYVSYYVNTREPGTYSLPEGQTAPPTTAGATQAATQPPTGAPGGFVLTNLVAAGNGFYDLTLSETQVTGLDRTKTHTVAGWVVRTSAANVDADVAFGSFNFVPTGGAAAQRDEVVSDAACNRCHGTLQAHGTRRGIQLCITCHSPQTTDPETSRTVDFKEMVHKIHTGSSLPSVRQGTGYFIVGNSQSVHDYSEVAFPWHDHGVAHCTVCHTGGEDADNWRARPNLAACASCHDNVKFDGSAAINCGGTARNAWTIAADCNHSAGAIAPANRADPAACIACHGPGAGNRVDLYHHGD